MIDGFARYFFWETVKKALINYSVGMYIYDITDAIVKVYKFKLNL